MPLPYILDAQMSIRTLPGGRQGNADQDKHADRSWGRGHRWRSVACVEAETPAPDPRLACGRHGGAHGITDHGLTYAAPRVFLINCFEKMLCTDMTSCADGAC
jgi:hypothetical protein